MLEEHLFKPHERDVMNGMHAARRDGNGPKSFANAIESGHITVPCYLREGGFKSSCLLALYVRLLGTLALGSCRFGRSLGTLLDDRYTKSLVLDFLP